jgi:aryl-alcohol dehydrogenase-like predicted oxidoreductase
MAALTDVVRSGKARHIGFSEWSAEQIRAALELSREQGYVKFVSSQPQYSMLHRDPEPEVFPLCRENGISQIVWSPLAQGALTGKYKPGAPPPQGSRATSPSMGSMMGSWLDPKVLEKVQRLVPIAERLGITMSQLALAWVLRLDDVASAIVGASRPEQVHENAAASETELDAETLAEIDRVLG